MSQSANYSEHTRRFDPTWITTEVNHRTGTDYEVLGTADLGESGGAVFVRSSTGHDRVITGSQGTAQHELQLAADVLGVVRSKGLPVPRIYDVVSLPGGLVALVQERLPGRPMRGRHSPHKIRALIDINERLAGLLGDRHDVPVPSMNLRHSGPAIPRFGWHDGTWHEALAGHSDDSRRLLGRIQEIGAASPDRMTGDDLLQLDLNGDNILIDEDGQLTGLVDWNWGVARGDRSLALVHLRLCMAWGTLNPDIGRAFYEAMELLDAHLAETVDPDLLLMYSAHSTLHMVAWAIRQWPSHVIEAFIRTGEGMLT